MPGDGRIDLIKDSGSRHDRLSAPAFFCRASVNDHCASPGMFLQVIFKIQRGSHNCRAEKIVSASMSVSRLRTQFLLQTVCLLTEPVQSIVLRQKTDHRSPASIDCPKCGRDISHLFFDLEPMLSEYLDHSRFRTVFLILDLCGFPDRFIQNTKFLFEPFNCIFHSVFLHSFDHRLHGFMHPQNLKQVFSS